ncbi:hypothetical protein AQUCO_00300802v1 [Aquilegia coerulea]|uniref:SANT domain-containing protein n=1 Tax=Aquilegia coerulea TaxID=218851 RepID=A0A2G5F0N4_AQUCA|nr:hypothetical protein AQUCO_00300802v1 [Aquilegia coerulea]
MEMDPIELGCNGESILEGTSDDHLLSQSSPDMNTIFGNPQVPPRVGDQYQVDIPPLVTESEHIQLTKQPDDTEVMLDQSFLIGLPVPIMWVCEQVDKTKHAPMEFYGDSDVRRNINMLIGSGSSRGIHINSKNEDSKLEMCSNKGHSAFPGSSGSSWTNLEVKSFLLGLYIFGKNLVQVRKFVETKEIGDVLSYYYGRFYRSNDYHRWSECRKMKNRKCILGQRIFTGWRQHEFLSRLFSHSSEECQHTLSEISKAFAEGKISLEEYVFILKATVGMNSLIEAIGIGKGRQDLTGIVDTVKTSRPDIPTGKECNSLSSGDILKFLTGDFRLSKNKSNDLFWEAVWPRLLATGWHSEQPRNYAGSKNSLVFLVPGVKKYSKRRCVKGKQYFDSVTDVLNKVVSNPRLLDIEGETPNSEGKKEENGWNTEQKFDQNGLSDGRRQCYLQPRIPNSEPDIVKFTVVDTSLVDGEGPLKVRELRTLPVDTIVSTPASLSRETDTNSSEEPEDEPKSADMLSNGQGASNTSRHADDTCERGVCIERLDYLLSDSKQEGSINLLDIPDVPMEDHENHRVNTCKDKHPSNTKCEFNQRGKLRQSNYLAPFSKRRRLSACGKEQKNRSASGFSLSSRLKEEDPCCSSDSPGASENMVGLPREKLSNGSSIKGSSGDCSEGMVSENGVVTAMFVENVERRPLIDLNLPHDPQDFEIGGPVTTEVGDSQDDAIRKKSSFPIGRNEPYDSQVLETSYDMVDAEQEPIGIRQSTRNRPLTTKALEALALGYLSSKRKPRGGKAMLQENPISRPSRCARGRSSVNGNIIDGGNGVVDKAVEECSSNTNIMSNSQVLSEREVSHELLGAASAACCPELFSPRR